MFRKKTANKRTAYYRRQMRINMILSEILLRANNAHWRMSINFPLAAFGPWEEPEGLVNTTALNFRSCLCRMMILYILTKAKTLRLIILAKSVTGWACGKKLHLMWMNYLSQRSSWEISHGKFTDGHMYTLQCTESISHLIFETCTLSLILGMFFDEN